MKIKSNKGFTLLELMIVLVVVAAITLFAIAQYSDKTKKAKIALAETTLKEMGHAIEKARLKGGDYMNNNIKDSFESMLTKKNGEFFITYSDDNIPIYSVDYRVDALGSNYILSIAAVGDWLDVDDENAVMCVNSFSSLKKGSQNLCEVTTKGWETGGAVVPCWYGQGCSSGGAGTSVINGASGAGAGSGSGASGSGSSSSGP